jgi:hypothetical protein
MIVAPHPPEGGTMKRSNPFSSNLFRITLAAAGSLGILFPAMGGLDEAMAQAVVVPDFQVNENGGGADQFAVDVARNGSGAFVLVWLDARNGDSDIYGQRFSSSGTPSGDDFSVSDDGGAISQGTPSVAIDSSGGFVVAWNDERDVNEDDNIYVQRYLDDGTALGSNSVVNDAGVGTSHQLEPSISSDRAGNFVVAWRDQRTGDADIYAQRYNSNGAKIGVNWRVNDDGGTAAQYEPVVAMNEGGSFAVAWEDRRDGDYNIYAQRYDADGNPVAGNFEVNDDAGSDGQRAPALDILFDGTTVLVWEDDRNGSNDVYAQRFTGDGVPIGPNMKVNEDGADIYGYDPAVSFDGDGGFVVAWEDGRNDDGDVYAQRYASDGMAVGGNFRVNDDATTVYQAEPSVSANANGEFVIAWTDRREGDEDIYAQRYENDGAPLNVNFRVTSTSEKTQWSPNVALRDDRIYMAWVDSRAGGSGYDIWANVLTFGDPIGTGDDVRPPRSFSLALGQNYPNPFNPSTTITFDLPGRPGDRRPVTLVIFDLRGRRVRSLVDADLDPGRHRIHWDGRDDRGESVASGLFLYTLRAGDETFTRKMMVSK